MNNRSVWEQSWLLVQSVPSFFRLGRSLKLTPPSSLVPVFKHLLRFSIQKRQIGEIMQPQFGIQSSLCFHPNLEVVQSLNELSLTYWVLSSLFVLNLKT